MYSAAQQPSVLCTEEEIRTLVHDFYDDVRQDALLGPIFNSRIHDWDAHLAKLVDFWSSIRCTAAPMRLP